MQIPRFEVSTEQVIYAQKLVLHSLEKHTTSNIWGDGDKTYHYRLTGVLGEVVFADLYNLPRPMAAFGAAGGQDNGSDFVLGGKNIDIKASMQNVEIPKIEHGVIVKLMQLNRPNSKTDIYFFMRFYTQGWRVFCYLFGAMPTLALKSGDKGVFRAKGEAVHRANGAGILIVDIDCMDIALNELIPIKISDELLAMPNFKMLTL
jgi:hypothetical protein